MGSGLRYCIKHEPISTCCKLCKSARKVIDKWIEAIRFPFQRHEQMIAELKARTSVDFATLCVTVSGADGLRAAGVV